MKQKSQFSVQIFGLGKFRNRTFCLLFFCCFFGRFISAQRLSSEEIQAAAKDKFSDAIFDLKSFLALRNDGHFPEEVEQNLKWCDSVFSALDFEVKRISTEGAPLLFAEQKISKKAKTILFYLQIDGQPVDSTKWNQPNAFEATLKEKQASDWKTIAFEKLQTEYDADWRIFARSASDSKGPAMAFISALQILQSKKLKPQFNIKVIMDFQEEMGSPHLAPAVVANKELLAADMMLIMDGTRHLSNLPTLCYGARGIATATLRVFGPRTPLHSGQYGNFAPNPIFETAKLLGSLKDENGRVTLAGFYDGISISDSEKKALLQVPENRDSLLLRLGVAGPDAVGDNYQEALQYPTLNIRGLKAAWVGNEVRTIIPAEVIAEIDMRLVPESDGTRLMEALKSHIQAQGYHLVDSLPTDAERRTHPKLASFNYRLGSKPFRTPMDSDTGTFLNTALQKVFGEDIVNMRTTGGSQPIAPFINTLGIPAVSVRIPNPDNNIHSPNENLRLGNFLEGIVTCLAILDQPLD
ncbi:M20/M25/M40 family metallo-hydrolase [Aggregatimonas sangjinii]|uniref:M20/M25/M40 family metallo-hydrolase n=1 Tax=Aggregatimonas sangjinii TaxID=2583587 RepID=A0A5B7SV99_9FLAO|nr:M20/M25/M40 family metallo-hydrolase [Aggregatimonas sangjinii]QCX00760.1 M20/M25/M40 family metallo-hydrolase [Aggregatimonas sangjinii]